MLEPIAYRLWDIPHAEPLPQRPGPWWEIAGFVAAVAALAWAVLKL